jgi:histidinol-phosphate/aromatic aminotransferase/cobyric acid decarboxylase-like protein
MLDEKKLDELNPTPEDSRMMEDITELCEEGGDSYTVDSMQWYLKEIGKIPRLTIEKEQELAKKIKEEGILIRHFATKGIDDFVRISIGTKEQMEALKKAFEKLL